METLGRVTRRTVLAGAIAVAVGAPLGCGRGDSGNPTLTLPPFQPPPQPLTEPPAQPLIDPAPGQYGSGKLAPWKTKGRVISTSHEVRRVIRSNGVVMFGDSLGVQDGPALARQLAARTGDALAVHSWAGQPVEPAVDVLEFWAGTYGLPGRILMAVGSNDIFNPPVVAGQVERVMAIAGRRRTVVWVDVQVERPATVVADRANSAWVNRQLSAATRRHSNLRLVRWAEFLAADSRRNRRYLRDGVHTTLPGRQARNELIIRALAAANGRD